MNRRLHHTRTLPAFRTIKRQGLAICEKVTVTAFARRRLPIIMLKLKMAETTKDAVMYIE